MKSESSAEAAPEFQGERLTLRRARIALIRQLCSACLLSTSGLYLFFYGHEVVAGSCCLGAIGSAVSLPFFWRQYRLVETGVVVTIQRQVSPQLAHVHPAASIVITSLLTLMVLITGVGTLYILPLASWSLTYRGFFAGFNLLLWLVTGFLWYRVATGRRKSPVVEPVYEQGEGVWPPAPRTPKNEGNGSP